MAVGLVGHESRLQLIMGLSGRQWGKALGPLGGSWEGTQPIQEGRCKSLGRWLEYIVSFRIDNTHQTASSHPCHRQRMHDPLYRANQDTNSLEFFS